jgi:hypothetical protein
VPEWRGLCFDRERESHSLQSYLPSPSPHYTTFAAVGVHQHPLRCPSSSPSVCIPQPSLAGKRGSDKSVRGEEGDTLSVRAALSHLNG